MLSFQWVIGQDIKFKKHKVIINQKEVLSFEQAFLSDYITFRNLDDDKEVVYIHKTIAPHAYGADIQILYFTLSFVEQQLVFETQKFNNQTFKQVFKKLVEQGVVMPNGHIDEEALLKFRVKYEDVLIKKLIISAPY